MDFQTDNIEEKVKQLKLENKVKITNSNHNDNKDQFNNNATETLLGKYSFTFSLTPIDPPPFQPISLLYTEEVIWTRLQIKEFLFKFGDILNIETRLLTGLQNIQGGWRVRGLCTTLVWEALRILSDYHNTKNMDVATTGHHQTNMISDSVKQMARKIINDWATDFGLSRSLIPNKQERIERTGEMLIKKGMNGQRWQDVAELLAMADHHHLPIPTSTNTLRKQQQIENNKMDLDNDEEEGSLEKDHAMDDVDMDIDQEIIKFRKKERTPLSTADELYMIQLLLDTLLFDNKLRSQLFDNTKSLKQLDEELKTYRKSFEAEEQYYKSQQNQLSESVDQFTSLGQKEKAAVKKKELDNVIEQLKQCRMDMEKKELETMIQKNQLDKRSHHLMTPWDGNDYWLFHDILSHHHIEGTTMTIMDNTQQQHHQQQQQQDGFYWAYGIIVIGKDPSSLSTSNESTTATSKDESDQGRAWWHISSIPHLQKLDKWLAYCTNVHRDEDYMATLESDIKAFRSYIVQHIHYLKLLESVIYGQGYFN
ncbi:hypothetical protein BJ944DRAFT_230865 [Cunninghamella echinulata]|nr:hypothetical protein BJ944DRAFT_230865 [Cunninghamella echinulata]